MRNCKTYVIVCLSLERLSQEFFWNSALVPLSLARITPVVYFEPPWDALVGIIKNPLKWAKKMEEEKKIIRNRKIPESLKRVKLFSFFPWGWTNPWISMLNKAFVLLQIKWHIRHYSSNDRILLTYWRDSANIIEKIPARRRVYHCLHEIAGFPWPDEKAKVQAITEEIKVVKTVDTVLVVSNTLTEKMSQYNRNVKLLEDDVVDFELFDKDIGEPVSDELKSLPHPKAGYVGNLSKFKQDFELIDTIALALPNWFFVIIGPYKIDIKSYDELPRKNNIIYVGSRPREEVPKYVASFDVCLIPHKDNLYNRHSFPMKLFEYFALGKPVVATDMPALRPYKKYVYIAKNAEEFVRYLKLALEEDSPEKQKERIQFAASHSWKDRGPKILKLLID